MGILRIDKGNGDKIRVRARFAHNMSKCKKTTTMNHSVLRSKLLKQRKQSNYSLVVSNLFPTIFQNLSFWRGEILYLWNSKIRKFITNKKRWLHYSCAIQLREWRICSFCLLMRTSATECGWRTPFCHSSPLIPRLVWRTPSKFTFL